MAPRRFVLLASAILTGGLLVVGCAGPSGQTVAKGASGARPGSAAPSPAQAKRAAHKARPSYPEHPPQLGLRTPMKGEPADAALAEARLVASNCSKAEVDGTDALLKEMRAAVDASFKEWHDEQPGCWEAMREEHRWKQMEMRDPSPL